MSAKKKRVLVVDDEPDLLEVLNLYISASGFEVEQANCGNEALTRLKNSSLPIFDWILTDMRMPNGSGLDLLHGLKAIEFKTRPQVLVVSGYADVSEQDVIKLGAFGLLTKPVNFSKLIAILGASVS